MSATTIRPATVCDIERIREIEVDAGEMFRAIGLDAVADDPPPARDILSSHIDDRTAWVAEVDGRVVGYAISSIVDVEGHLDQVSLERGAAGQGIGARLISEVIRWSKESGCTSLTLTTFRDVAWNAPYYARLGFSVLADNECGPQLLELRAMERQGGIEVRPRVAMRLQLS